MNTSQQPQQQRQQTRPQQQQRAGQPAQTRALAQTAAGSMPARWGMTSADLDLLRRTKGNGLTNDEFAHYMTVAHRAGLDPFRNQIHAYKRWDPILRRESLAIVVGIDGYRLCASRTGEDDGRQGPFWCGSDRKWRDVWVDPEPPRAAKIRVYRKGRQRPYTAVAHWDSYVQIDDASGEPVPMWRTHGAGQLLKCAEALALRMAFPDELSGTHTPDELRVNAIDVGFTEVDTTASSPAAGAGSDAGAVPPAVSPAAPAAVSTATHATRKSLTEEEMAEILDLLARCEDRGDVKALGQLVDKSGATEDQRERLRVAFEDRLVDIDDETADADEAKAGGKQ